LPVARNDFEMVCHIVVDRNGGASYVANPGCLVASVIERTMAVFADTVVRPVSGRQRPPLVSAAARR
jgi:hypothetical protein